MRPAIGWALRATVPITWPRIPAQATARLSGPAGAVPGMAAGYDEHSLSQQQAFSELLLPRLLAEIDARAAADDLVIADYGCASATTTAVLIERVLERRPRQRTTIVLQDLPGNDWDVTAATLARYGDICHRDHVHGKRCVGNRGCGRALHLTSARGSFHDRVLPTGSVDIAMSSTAFHWLSSTADLPDPGVLVYARSPGADSMAVRAWERRARDDWRRVIAHRGTELRPGGVLALTIPATDVHGRFSYRELGPAFEAALAALPAHRRDRPAGTPPRHCGRPLGFPFPWLGRTKPELVGGFAQQASPRGLVLRSIAVAQLCNPYHEGGDDDGAGAARYADSVMAWAGRMVDVLDHDAIRDLLTRELAARWAALERDYVQAVIVADKPA